MTNRTPLNFSLFENLNGIQGAFQTTPTQQLTFSSLIEYYNSKNNIRLSNAILNAPTEAEKKKLKNKRAYYTPYGTFSQRNNDSILFHNNVISIDIDNLDSRAHAEEIRNNLKKHPSILFCLLSARGKGVKGLMLVNATYTPQDQYTQLKHVFKPYLAEFLNIDAIHIDTAQFKVSQPCYFSYDAEMYVNESATPLNLDFNYKEEPRAEFVPAKVPINAKDRVDAYILGVLNKKLETLTPAGARHPKLYSVKILGQLSHYAPHLENHIIDSFINGGVAMYGKENMRSNVKSCVVTAYNEGVKEPINNNAIESILAEEKELKTLVKKVKNNRTLYHTNKEYIGQDQELCNKLINTILNQKFTVATAPTGAGKSKFIEILEKNTNKKICFLAPLRTIVEQQENQKAVILGETTPEQIKIAQKYNLFYSTFASAHKTAGAQILVIDESHLLSDRSNILFSEIQCLTELIEKAEHVLFLSATTNPLLTEIFNTKEIVITTNQNKKEVQPIFYKAPTRQADAVIKHLRNSINPGVNVVFWNNKTALETLQKDLVKLGIYKDDEIAKFTADTIDIESQNYKDLINNQHVNESIKLILATSKISEGVNIKNTNAFNILLVGCVDVNYFNQAIGRFRKCKDLKINILFNDAFNTRKGNKYNAFKLYNQLLEEIKATPKLITDYSNKKENLIPIVSFDYVQRSIMYINNERVINSFELMHEVKQIQESNFNFNIWREAIQEKNAKIVFKAPIYIEEQTNLELHADRQERKKEKAEFLEKMRNVLATKHAGAVLYEIANHTRNTRLKSYLKELLYILDVQYLNTNDKILFFENFDKIESYVQNIIKITEATNLSFIDAGILFNHDKNYTITNFDILIKRLVSKVLKDNGASNIEEGKMLQRIGKIENTFKGYIKDNTAVFKKQELFQIIRTDLNYRCRTENINIIMDKIGVVFDVTYSKTDKTYTLKKIENNYYQSLFYLIEKKQNEVMPKPLDCKGLTAFFKPLNDAHQVDDLVQTKTHIIKNIKPKYLLF